MQSPNFFILYVDDPAKSAAFYQDLLGRAPVESSPTFAMFGLDAGVMLGLWSRRTVEPAARSTGGGHEVCFAVEGKARVDELFADLNNRGLTIAQAPVELDFGYTFVALDPDQHRLRVFASNGS
jgi:catechol 2,3-dioxygenase-like lactoylglutathione lyase family enzyme